MNDDSPNAQREELEQKLTALLLGELDPVEASAIEERLAREGDLARLHARLKQTLGLVRHAVAQPSEPAASTAELPSIDPARREHVLRVLRSNRAAPHPVRAAAPRVIPVRFLRGPDSTRSWYGRLAIAACMVLLLGAAALWLRGDATWSRRMAGLKLMDVGEVRTLEENRVHQFGQFSKGLAMGNEPGLAQIEVEARSQGTPAAVLGTEVRVSRRIEGRSPAEKEVSAALRFNDAGTIKDATAAPEFGLNRADALRDGTGAAPARRGTLVPAVPAPPAAAPAQQRGRAVLGDTPQLGRFFKLEGAERGSPAAARPAAAMTESLFEEPTVERLGRRPEAVVAEQEVGIAGGARFGVAGVNEVVRPLARSEPEDLALVEPRLEEAKTRLSVEVATTAGAFSTFSLNVTDVSFKLAEASLGNGALPPADSVRSEEFLNAFEYRDPETAGGAPLALAWERARYPFAHNREVLRLAVRTAASGREPGRPLILVLAIDNSGSMERADRVRIIHEALRTLAAQLKPADRVSVVAFARTARLWVDGLPGDRAGELVDAVGGLNPEGGTNLEDALRVAYETAIKHFHPEGVNRVVLLTDGAANLGELRSDVLRQLVESHRRRGIALDCFGIGWEGYNDDLLEALARNGDGRYGFVNTPQEAATGLVDQLAGAFKVAAQDVKVQVEFNPRRVSAWRQVGYARHQLTRQQFRDNTVDAAELGAAESGNALYILEVHPRGEGPLGLVRVRYRVPGTDRYDEHEWFVPYSGGAPELAEASPALRLATVAGAFAEWLAGSPHAAEVTTDRLLALLTGVPAAFEPDPRPAQLETMIRQAKSISGQ
jgi:Mg-chelatase subunit ChlD